MSSENKTYKKIRPSLIQNPPQLEIVVETGNWERANIAHAFFQVSSKECALLLT